MDTFYIVYIPTLSIQMDALRVKIICYNNFQHQFWTFVNSVTLRKKVNQVLEKVDARPVI